MSTKKVAVALLFLLVAAKAVLAEVNVTDTISMDSQIRYRYEVNGRDFDAQTGQYDFSTMRSYLGFNLRPNDALMIRANFGEARYLGTTKSNSQSTAFVEMHEVYFEYKTTFGGPLAIRVGRFESWYGSKRIMGSGGWNVYGPRSYDGFRLRWGNKTRFLDLFQYVTVERSGAVAPSNGDAFDEQDRRLMGVAGKVGDVRPLLLVDWDGAYSPGQKDADLIVTPSVNYHRKAEAFNLNSNLGYQFGRKNDKDLSSYLVSATVTYTTPWTYTPSFGVGIDMTSGNSLSQSENEDHVFYAPFMSRHAHRGFMDYFKDVNQGLTDIIGKVGIKPVKAASLSLDLHHFRYVESASGPSGDYTNLGNEADLRLVANLHPGLKLDTAYCLFVPTEDFKPSGDTATFFYLALTASF